MIDIYLLGACIFLLAVLLVFLPLGLTWKGKGIVFISGTGIGFLAYFSFLMFLSWVIFPILVFLLALWSYLIIKNVDIFKDAQVQKKNLDQQPEPLFAYAELKERARYAETIDQYYMDAGKLADANEAQGMANERKEAFSNPLGQTEIDQLLQHQLSEVAATEEPNVKEMDFDQPKIKVPDKSEENSIGSVSPAEAFLEEQQEKQEPEPEPSDSVIPSMKEHPFDMSTTDIPKLEDQLEKIDFSQRVLAAEKFAEKATESSADFGLSSDEEDLIEIRKRLFAKLDEDPVVNDDHEPRKTEIQQPANNTAQKDEVEETANQGGQAEWDDLQTVYDEKQAKSEEAKTANGIGQTKSAARETAAANRFSSPELEAAFDDLAELYLKKKEEEHK